MKHIHLIFKTHLDLGFTDFARNVVRDYFESYIPNAIELAATLRNGEMEDRFIWTTGSWLVFEYLEQASPECRRRAEEAILAGDLVWHALPFTFHSELVDASLFRYGLTLSKRLDDRFGKTTIAAKMTDVPGHTRAIVPLLAEAGVRFLHIGRNRASSPPAVPDAFLWRHTDGSEVAVVYHHDYGYTSVVDGMQSGIAFAHGRDNHPPQDAAAVASVFRRMRKKHPGATVDACGMDDYASEIWNFRSRLPVISEELADTWIHGVASHPERVASLRALSRLRRKWIDEKRFDETANPGHDQFSRLLMCVPEHTWGIMVDQLEDNDSFDGPAFERLRASELGRRVEASWDEQIAYMRSAVSVLNGDMKEEAKAALRMLHPSEPDVDEWEEFSHDRPVVTERFEIGIDGDTGSISHLRELRNNRIWADAEHRLGSFMFENFSLADFDRFARQYIRKPKTTAWWSLLGFTKLGMDPDRLIEYGRWFPRYAGSWLKTGSDATDILVRLDMPEEAVERFGSPARIYMRTRIRDDRPAIELTVDWFGKAACRLPAACWVGIRPLVAEPRSWRMQKTGSSISPFEVIKGGNRRMHAVEEVRYDAQDGRLTVIPVDSALLAPGRPALTHFDQRQPGLANGLWFNLWNNVWNTNFPYWHGGDCRFRFEIEFGGPWR